jgi:alpha-galactosidase
MKGVVEGNQGHTYGLSFWLPYQGTGCYVADVYSLRSFYLPAFGTVGFTPETAAIHRQAYVECARIAPLMLADYYPLTDYSRQADKWIAWQFNRPERGDGVVQAFRRSQCEEKTMSFRLRGLNPKARYEVMNFDQRGIARISGSELIKNGLVVEIRDKPGAAIIAYHTAKEEHF